MTSIHSEENPFSAAIVALLLSAILAVALLLRFLLSEDVVVGFALRDAWPAILLLPAAIPAAMRGSMLTVAVRHTYNIHYAAIAGTASSLLMLSATILLGSSNLLMAIGISSMVFATGWTFAHLFAGLSDVGRWSFFSGACAALVAVSLLVVMPAWMLVILALLPLITVLVLPTEVEQGMKPASAGWAVIAFLLLNMAILLGIGCLFALGIYGISLRFSVGPQPSFPLLGFLLRWGIGLVSAALVGSLVYTWPVIRLTRVGIGLAAGVLVAAAGSLSQASPAGYLLSGITVFAALCGATLLAAREPRRARLPYAVLAWMVAFTLSLQIVGLPAIGPALAFGLWTLEAALLGGLWIGAYLFGIRPLRNRFELVPAERLEEEQAEAEEPEYRHPAARP